MEINKVYNEDCIGEKGMCLIPDKSIDMILCDLPYGTTACKWDSVIPFEPLWGQYERIIKDSGAIVLTASQPFTSALVMSNTKLFKYEWIWKKNRATGFVHAKNKPMKAHENVLVFSKGTTIHIGQSKNRMDYYPQGLEAIHKIKKRTLKDITDTCFAYRKSHKSEYIRTETSFPKSVVDFETDMLNIHPTAKPVALFEYLIKTYTNEGETVLDNCMGSGTTAIACINTNRNYIGFEKEEKYFNIIQERIKNHTVKPNTINIISKEPSLFDIL